MLTNNFYNLLKSCAGGYNPTLNPVYSISSDVKLVSLLPATFGNFFCPNRIGIKTSLFTDYDADSYPMILFGTDTEAPSRDNLRFSPILNSGSTSLKTSLGYKVYPHIQDNTVSCTHHIQIIGRNSSPVTITKLGLVILGDFSESSSYDYNYVLLDATSLSSPVTINNGDTVFLDYQISMDLSLNIF